MELEALYYFASDKEGFKGNILLKECFDVIMGSDFDKGHYPFKLNMGERIYIVESNTQIEQ